jgi:hypothetical protein
MLHRNVGNYVQIYMASLTLIWRQQAPANVGDYIPIYTESYPRRINIFLTTPVRASSLEHYNSHSVLQIAQVQLEYPEDV